MTGATPTREAFPVRWRSRQQMQAGSGDEPVRWAARVNRHALPLALMLALLSATALPAADADSWPLGHQRTPVAAAALEPATAENPHATARLVVTPSHAPCTASPDSPWALAPPSTAMHLPRRWWPIPQCDRGPAADTPSTVHPSRAPPLA